MVNLRRCLSLKRLPRQSTTNCERAAEQVGSSDSSGFAGWRVYHDQDGIHVDYHVHARFVAGFDCRRHPLVQAPFHEEGEHLQVSHREVMGPAGRHHRLRRYHGHSRFPSHGASY